MVIAAIKDKIQIREPKPQTRFIEFEESYIIGATTLLIESNT
jgi:hypothetical protein